MSEAVYAAGASRTPAEVLPEWERPGVALKASVFLSYASQDTDAAQRIAESLRGVGVEVWFDRNELLGGDAWDAKIRQRIKTCTLFIAIISANTQKRREGYFRLEWKMAAQRMHTMVDGMTFLLPVVADTTPGTIALVPDEFRVVQWTQLPPEGPLTVFADRVKSLLAAPVAFSERTSPAFESGAHRTGGRSPDARSLAVLPFANLSDDKDNEYFSDGISEELINVLGKVGGLKVAARTSTFYFKGRSVPVSEIARKLSVAYVIEGSVRKLGNRVRIGAQLIKASDGFQVWSEHFNRELQDIFALQDEIAGLIAQRLQPALLEGPPEAIAGAPGAAAPAAVPASTPPAAVAAPRFASTAAGEQLRNVDAYASFLQGRYFLATHSPDNLARAVRCFRQAVQLDPTYALARANEAFALNWLISLGVVSFEQTIADARNAGAAAVALAPGLAEAHAAMGDTAALSWDWPLAREASQRALALAPQAVDVLQSASWCAFSAGDLAGCAALSSRAIEIDPLNTAACLTLAMSHLFAGRLADAEVIARRLHTMDVDKEFGDRLFWRVAVLRGDWGEVLKIDRAHTGKSRHALGQAIAFHALGQPAESAAALQRLIPPATPADLVDLALAHTWRGEVDEAFDVLDAALAQHASGLAALHLNPLFAALRKDARWPGVLAKMGLGGWRDLARPV